MLSESSTGYLQITFASSSGNGRVPLIGCRRKSIYHCESSTYAPRCPPWHPSQKGHVDFQAGLEHGRASGTKSLSTADRDFTLFRPFCGFQEPDTFPIRRRLKASASSSKIRFVPAIHIDKSIGADFSRRHGKNPFQFDSIVDQTIGYFDANRTFFIRALYIVFLLTC